MSFLATDGGVHPPDKLAQKAADEIGALIVIDETSNSKDARTARRFKPRLILDIRDAIEDHYDEIMTFERAQIAKGTGHLSTPIDPTKHAAHAKSLAAAVDAVVAAGTGTMFAASLDAAPGRALIAKVIGNWFATAIDIERDWAARGFIIDINHKARPNPAHDTQCPHVRGWLAKRGK